MRALFALTLAAALSQPARAAESLKPAGPWVVAYEDGVCLLQRDFGIAERPVRLTIRQVPTLASVRIFVSDEAVGQPIDPIVRIAIGSGAPIKAPLTTYASPDRSRRYTETEVPRRALAGAAQGAALSFDAGASMQYSLAVPGLDKALAQVDACVADQLAHWGLDAQQQAAMARHPVPRDDLLEGSEPFVLASREVKGSGQNIAIVAVDSSGRPSGCRIAVSSGNEGLDQASCDVLLDTEFRPAEDRRGQAVTGIYVHSFRWRGSQ